jgi:hypothetical protein
MRLPCHRALSVQRCGARAFAGSRGLPSPFPLRRASSFASTRAKGDALEDRVAALLRLEGVPPSAIRRNVIVKDANGNRSEIDLVYRTRPWWLGGRLVYVECKNYGSGPSITGKSSSTSPSSSASSSASSVPLEDVAKFKAVLALLNVSPRQGLFVANGSYTPRATTIGIRTVDGRQLLDWERRARRRHRARRGAGLLAGTVAAGVALLAGGVAFSPDLSAAFDREMGGGRSAGGLWDGGGGDDDDDHERTVRRLVPASARAAAADGIAWLLARRGEWIRGWDEGRALQPLPGGFGSRWGGGGGEWGAASPPSSPSFLSSIAAFVRPLLPFVSAPPSASVAGRLGRAAGEASAGAEASLAEALRVVRKGVGG